MNRNLGDRLQQGENIYSIVEELFDHNKTEILSTTPLLHRCRCSHETLFSLMKSFGKEEIRDMIEKDGGAVITCTFCTNVYSFTKDELSKLL